MRSLLALAAMLALARCVASNYSAPIAATNDFGCTGELHRSARAYSVLGLVAWGDASIETARTDLLSGFRLSRFRTVEFHRRSLLGVSSFETIICGFFVRDFRAREPVRVARKAPELLHPGS